MRYKTIAGAAVALALLAGTAACTSSGSDSTSSTANANAKETANAGAGLDLIFTNQPAPVFATSAYRQQLIEVEAVEALGTPTTAFFFPPGWNGTGSHPFKVCSAQGLPIPNSTQLDNPDEIVQDPYGGGYQLNQGGLNKPQADPIGVYTPTTGTGTYVTCLGKGGSLEASYWEGDVYDEAAPAEWNTSQGMVEDIGPGALPVCTLATAHYGDGSGIATKDNKTVTYEHCVPRAKTTSDVWPLPKATPHGYVLTAYRSHGPLVVSCSFKKGTYRNTKTGKLQHDGVVSTCQFPDQTTLTFAPWGIVK